MFFRAKLNFALRGFTAKITRFSNHEYGKKDNLADVMRLILDAPLFFCDESV